MAHQFYFNPYILDNLPAPAAGFDVVRDLSEPRLQMYITSHGVKTFFIRRRARGRDRRIIIGKYPEMDIEAARAAVSAAWDAAAVVPRVTHRPVNFHRFVKFYIANRVRRAPASQEKLIRAIERHLGPLFENNIGDITSNDIAAVIERIDGAAIAARMHELLLSIFKYAIERGHITENPVVSVVRPMPVRRVRPLGMGGVRRLRDVIMKMDDAPVLRAAFLMLIYGFAPRSKIFSMQWRDLDFNHYMFGDMPLSDMAAVLLSDMPQNGRWVFPGRGRGHLTDPRCAWHRVANAAVMPTLTMDDVHKFMMRHLTWTSDREDMRQNMNILLSQIFD